LKLKVYYVDAFTSETFGGNPAGVVVTGEALEKKWMQKIAGELNLSETVFVKIDPNNPKTFQTRFFTPVTEVELCGHATIAAFYVLAVEGFIPLDQPRFHVKQKTLHEELGVEILKEDKDMEILMEQSPPRLINTHIDLDRLSSMMGIEKEDIGINEHNKNKRTLLPGIAFTGLKDLIVPIKNLEALKKIRIEDEKLRVYSKELDIVGIHAFTPETLRKNTAHCRNFAPLVGIPEEAATGTASGALGYYLLINKYISVEDNEELKLTFEQGDFMGRPSEIRCYINNQKGNYEIKVGGKARIFLKGEILQPDEFAEKAKEK